MNMGKINFETDKLDNQGRWVYKRVHVYVKITGALESQYVGENPLFICNFFYQSNDCVFICNTDALLFQVRRCHFRRWHFLEFKIDIP